MNKIDRYIMRKFLFNFAWAMMAFWLVFVVVHLVEHLDDFIDKGAPLKYIVSYYLYFSPFILILVTPIGVLLATLFCVGFLSKRNELLAMRAAGVSLVRLSLPLLFLGLMVTGSVFVAGETVFPRSEEQRIELEAQFVRKAPRPKMTMVSNLFASGFDDRVFFFRRFNVIKGAGEGVWVQTFQQGRVMKLWEFEHFEYIDSVWTGIDARQRVFADSADSAGQYMQKDTVQFPEWKETPDDFVRKQIDPERTGYFRLKAAIARMNATGADTTVEQTELALKIAFPFLSFLVVLIGFPIAANTKRSGMALNFGIAMGVTFVLRVLIEIFRSLGHNGDVPPEVAAWVPNIVCLIGGLVALAKVRK